MRNLLRETIEILKHHGHTEDDVLWVGCKEFKTSWENFSKVADVEYDSGYGAQMVAQDLIINGTTFWLERNEYDGSEWWEYKSKEVFEPQVTVEIKAVTIDQGNSMGNDCGCGWASLSEINGFKKRYG